MSGKKWWSELTLTQLEDMDWGEPPFHSHVVTDSHRLRHQPLRDFSREDLRFMLVQQNSLPILMPMALDVLEIDPFSEDDELYAGALLNAAVRVEPQFWLENPSLWDRLHIVLLVVRQIHDTLAQEILPAADALQARLSEA